MWLWIAVSCLCVVAGSCVEVESQSDSLVVQIDQGPLRGFRDADSDIFTFLNVPYATAPTGRDKYKAPLPAKVWTEIFNATNRAIMCPQALPLPTQDDCLVADILIPAKVNITTGTLPVLVAVHGGGYMMGASYFLQYRNLVKTQKLIVVTFNYRLAVQGFLCLGTEGVPGNAGMKDQVAMLQWIKRNIASFGGNPDDVTIMGCSAGGGSVDLLTLSPMTRGLFHKVMTESGCSLGIAGVQVDPIEYAKTYARALNFSNVDDLDALEEFYKTASNELLLSRVDVMFNNSVFLFTPCVERDTGTGEERFLSETPWNILSKGLQPDFPLMYGFSNMEGLLLIGLFDALYPNMTENFSRYLPVDLQFECAEQKEEIAETVKKYYFGNKSVSSETVLKYVDYYTDIFFAYPMLKGLKFRRNNSSSCKNAVYLYEYSFTDKNTPLVPYTTVRGANHCRQAAAVIDEDVTNATPEYVQMKSYMRTMWINFVLTGNPTPDNSTQPDWTPVKFIWSPHMELNNTSEVMEVLNVTERVIFWDKIYDKHYRQPVPPSGPQETKADSLRCK